MSTIKEGGRRVNTHVGHNSEGEEKDEEEAMGATHLDTDSEEESDTEWLAWMTDLPLQFLVQQVGDDGVIISLGKDANLW